MNVSFTDTFKDNKIRIRLPPSLWKEKQLKYQDGYRDIDKFNFSLWMHRKITSVAVITICINNIHY